MNKMITIDRDLLSEAMNLTGIKNQQDIIHKALMRFVRIERQKEVLKLEGKINWIGNLDEMRESRFIDEDNPEFFVDVQVSNVSQDEKIKIQG